MIPSALLLRCFCNGSDCRALVPLVQLEFWSWLFHLKTKCCLVRFFLQMQLTLLTLSNIYSFGRGGLKGFMRSPPPRVPISRGLAL